MTTSVRACYLDTVDVAVVMLDEPALAAAWSAPSALAEYACGALAGHLVRSLLTVDTYLAELVTDEPDADPPLDAATYFVRALAGEDPITSPVHASVRARSLELAGPDATDLRIRAGALRDRLRARLPLEPADARVRVFGGMVMALDAYLDTRLVEIAVHLDDLAVSLGIATPALPDEAMRRTVAVAAEVARRRHGDLAVLRVLTRTERAPGPISAF